MNCSARARAPNPRECGARNSTKALQHFRKRRFEDAEQSFRETIRLRKLSEANGGPTARQDGPSLFYLSQIEDLRSAPPPPDWIGEVRMKDK